MQPYSAPHRAAVKAASATMQEPGSPLGSAPTSPHVLLELASSKARGFGSESGASPDAAGDKLFPVDRAVRAARRKELLLDDEVSRASGRASGLRYRQPA
jgi:hypothetical protein